MSTNPLNLVLRFLLEITALFAAGLWGWQQSDNWLKFLLAIGLPLIPAAIWGIFAVPGDPSRSGNAPVVVPGIIRLFIELGIFALAAWCFDDLGYRNIAAIFGSITLTHYALSYDRLLWLISR